MRHNTRILLSLAIIGLFTFIAAGSEIVPNDKGKDQKTESSTTQTDSSSSQKDNTQNTSSSSNSQSSSNSNSTATTTGEYVWPNGDKYLGGLKNGLPDGQGSFWIWSVAWNDWMEVYKGEWKNGKMNGQGHMELGTDGSYFDGTFKDNLPSGQGTLFDPMSDGPKTQTGNWTTARKNGYWITTSESGTYFGPIVPGE